MSPQLLNLTTFVILCSSIVLNRYIVANALSAERLVVVTVIDTSSPSVVTDSLSFFRSVRIFGGTFNRAVFKATILVKSADPRVELNLLKSLEALDIQYVIKYSILDEYSPTLNKYLGFQLPDSAEFDYMLWVDADVFVFSDPMSYLQAAVSGLETQSTPHVFCTPEVSNYMERFPLVNTSAALWNKSLAPFSIRDWTASGEFKTVPHGTCNTGVLLFNTAGLDLFLAYFPDLSLFGSFGYLSDRFIDSLLFVYTINIAGIEAKPLDYSLNYMAFIPSMSLYSNNPVFAHFIGSTYFSCYPELTPAQPEGWGFHNYPVCHSPGGLTAKDGDVDACIVCRCLYNEENKQLSRNIVRKLYEVGVTGKCQELAGMAPITTW